MALKEEQLEKDTLVMYLSDNGGPGGGGDRPSKPREVVQRNATQRRVQYEGKYDGQRSMGDNCPLRGGKGSHYEGGIRVHAVLSLPRRLKSRKVTEVISVCDIFPTMAYLAGASISDNLKIEGINVWSALTGGSVTKERVMYWRSGRSLALRKGDWKLIHQCKSLDEGSDELFNIAQDLLETKDLAKENPTKVKELRNELVTQFAMD